MAFCQYCGSPLGAIDKFCCVCGKPVITQAQWTANTNNIKPDNLNNPQFTSAPVFRQQPLQQSNPQNINPQYLQQTVSPQQTAYGNPPYTNFNLLIDNPFDRQVFETIKALNWLDKDQPSSDAIFCIVKDFPFSYQLKDSSGKTPEYFVLQVNVEVFKDREIDEILKITQKINCFFTTCKTYITSPLINSNDSINGIYILYCIKKNLIRDIKDTLEEAIDEMSIIASNILEHL